MGAGNMPTLEGIQIYLEQDIDIDNNLFNFLVKTDMVYTREFKICCMNNQDLTSCVAFEAQVTEATDCSDNVVTGSIDDTFQ